VAATAVSFVMFEEAVTEKVRAMEFAALMAPELEVEGGKRAVMLTQAAPLVPAAATWMVVVDAYKQRTSGYFTSTVLKY
jgi:hypothetical protein